jgi:hypothetical protein
LLMRDGRNKEGLIGSARPQALLTCDVHTYHRLSGARQIAVPHGDLAFQLPAPGTTSGGQRRTSVKVSLEFVDPSRVFDHCSNTANVHVLSASSFIEAFPFL